MAKDNFYRGRKNKEKSNKQPKKGRKAQKLKDYLDRFRIIKKY